MIEEFAQVDCFSLTAFIGRIIQVLPAFIKKYCIFSRHEYRQTDTQICWTKSSTVYECRATSKNEKNHSFYQFPKDAKLRLRWIARIHREGYKPSAFRYVCCFHFSERGVNKGSFSATPKEVKKKSLKKGSIHCWNLKGAEVDQ